MGDSKPSRCETETERFVLYVHYFSPLARSLCPDLPEWVYRIYDHQNGNGSHAHIPLENNRDLKAAQAVLAELRKNGRPDLDRTLALAQAGAARWRARER